MIPDEVMHAWLSVRRRNFDPAKGYMQFEAPDGETATVTYQQVWNELKSTEYFEPTDSFVPFMDKSHNEAIRDMEKLREEFRT